MQKQNLEKWDVTIELRHLWVQKEMHQLLHMPHLRTMYNIYIYNKLLFKEYKCIQSVKKAKQTIFTWRNKL